MSTKYNNSNYNIKGKVFLGNFAAFADPSLQGRNVGSVWTLNTKPGYELGRVQFMFKYNNNPSIFELVANQINEIVCDVTSLARFNSFLKMIIAGDNLEGIRETLNISSRPDNMKAQKPGFIEYNSTTNTLHIFVVVGVDYQIFPLAGIYQIKQFAEFINTLNDCFMNNVIGYSIANEYLVNATPAAAGGGYQQPQTSVPGAITAPSGPTSLAPQPMNQQNQQPQQSMPGAINQQPQQPQQPAMQQPQQQPQQMNQMPQQQQTIPNAI